MYNNIYEIKRRSFHRHTRTGIHARARRSESDFFAYIKLFHSRCCVCRCLDRIFSLNAGDLFSSIGFLVVVDIMNFWHTNEAEDTAEECAQLAIVLALWERTDKEVRACRGLSSIYELVPPEECWDIHLGGSCECMLNMNLHFLHLPSFFFSNTGLEAGHTKLRSAHIPETRFLSLVSVRFLLSRFFCRKARRKLRTISRPRLF